MTQQQVLFKPRIRTKRPSSPVYQSFSSQPCSRNKRNLVNKNSKRLLLVALFLYHQSTPPNVNPCSSSQQQQQQHQQLRVSTVMAFSTVRNVSTRSKVRPSKNTEQDNDDEEDEENKQDEADSSLFLEPNDDSFKDNQDWWKDPWALFEEDEEGEQKPEDEQEMEDAIQRDDNQQIQQTDTISSDEQEQRKQKQRSLWFKSSPPQQPPEPAISKTEEDMDLEEEEDQVEQQQASDIDGDGDGDDMFFGEMDIPEMQGLDLEAEFDALVPPVEDDEMEQNDEDEEDEEVPTLKDEEQQEVEIEKEKSPTELFSKSTPKEEEMKKEKTPDQTFKNAYDRQQESALFRSATSTYRALPLLKNHIVKNSKKLGQSIMKQTGPLVKILAAVSVGKAFLYNPISRLFQKVLGSDKNRILDDDDDEDWTMERKDPPRRWNLWSRPGGRKNQDKNTELDNDVVGDRFSGPPPQTLQQQPQQQRLPPAYELMDRLHSLQREKDAIANERAAMEREYEKTSVSLQEARSEIATLSSNTSFLKSKLQENQEGMERAIRAERRKARDALGRMKEAMLHVLEKERSELREKLMKQNAELRQAMKRQLLASVGKQQPLQGEEEDDEDFSETL